MEDKRYILIHANKYDIEEPEFFDTYDEAHKEMKRQSRIKMNILRLSQSVNIK